MDYERSTRDAYLTSARAAEYRKHQTKDWTWARFVTCLEQRAIARELGRYRWSSSDQLLDIPCGTGILGKVLRRFPFKIVASDISSEMMSLAREEYPGGRLEACVRADITATPFPRGSFACVVTLGFLHRVPREVKRAALREISALSNRVVIVSCSVDTPLQRLKHFLLSRLTPGHVPAPCPAPLEEVMGECRSQGLRVARAFMVAPVLSSHALLVLEK
ncbi:MAG: class I SAM-dependent methyltransferase [Elusimicrobia bacterium]|nr:class I SAM-dependent methyltransferase [Elusimicrobiota bacterium]